MKAMTETERQERQHARISPSKLKQYTSCLGSLAKLEKHPHLDVDGTNEHTLSGNKTGAILEALLNLQFDDRFDVNMFTKKSQDAVFEPLKDDTDKHERQERIMKAAQYISEFRQEVLEVYKDATFIHFGQEERFTSWDLSDGEAVSGSSDIAIAWRTGNQVHFAILDLKDGRHPVQADSPQLVAYAAGFARHLVQSKKATWDSFHQIHLGIIQPRCDNFDNRIITWNELKEEIKYLKEKSALALALTKEDEATIDTYLEPSPEACMFCKVKSVCPALQKPAMEFFSPIVAEEKPTPEVLLQGMTEEQKVRLVLNFKLLEGLKKAIQAELINKIKAGEKIEGIKLVNSKAPSRVWSSQINVDARRELLRKEGANPTELVDISPAQIEKQIGKKRFAELNLVEYKAHGVAVAGLNDKRKEIDCDEALFDVIDEEE
jgi:hypothetical protein